MKNTNNWYLLLWCMLCYCIAQDDTVILQSSLYSMDVSTVSFYCRVDVVRDFQLVWSINDKQIILFNTTSAVHETIRVNGTVATLLQINAQWGTSVLTTDEPDVIVKCSSLDSIQTTHHQHEVTDVDQSSVSPVTLYSSLRLELPSLRLRAGDIAASFYCKAIGSGLIWIINSYVLSFTNSPETLKKVDDRLVAILLNKAELGVQFKFTSVLTILSSDEPNVTVQCRNGSNNAVIKSINYLHAVTDPIDPPTDVDRTITSDQVDLDQTSDQVDLDQTSDQVDLDQTSDQVGLDSPTSNTNQALHKSEASTWLILLLLIAQYRTIDI